LGGPHVRFRRVQTLVREGSPLVKPAQFCLGCQDDDDLHHHHAAARGHRRCRPAAAGAEDRRVPIRLCERRELLHSYVRPITESRPEGRHLPIGLGGQRPFLHRGAAAALTSEYSDKSEFGIFKNSKFGIRTSEFQKRGAARALFQERHRHFPLGHAIASISAPLSAPRRCSSTATHLMLVSFARTSAHAVCQSRSTWAWVMPRASHSEVTAC
jgi:hypothetical protein